MPYGWQPIQRGAQVPLKRCWATGLGKLLPQVRYEEIEVLV